MNEENQKRLEAAAGGEKGFSIPHVECDDGWVVLLETLFAYCHHELKRWREVKDIDEKMRLGATYLPERSALEKHRDIYEPHIYRSSDWIEEYFEKNPTDPMLEFSVVQCKEKFGGLRCYADFPEGEVRERLQGAIALAEMLSYTICETCGQPGKVGGEGWIKTLCTVCRAKQSEATAKSTVDAMRSIFPETEDGK